MGTSSPFLCLDPLPSLPSTLHSHVLIIPAAHYHDTRGNRWLLSNRLLSRIRPVLVLSSVMLTVGRCLVRPLRVWFLTYSNNRDEMWWIDDGLYSYSAQTVRSVVWFAWRMIKKLRSRWPEMCHLNVIQVPSGFPPAVPAHLLYSFVLHMNVPSYGSTL